MAYETLHLEKYRGTHNFNLLLIFLPILAFVLTLAILIAKLGSGRLAGLNESNVLGTETKAAQTEIK
jgi:hypothetical protein